MPTLYNKKFFHNKLNDKKISNKKISNKKISNKKMSNKKMSNKKISNKMSKRETDINRIICQEYDGAKNLELGKIKPRIGSHVIIILKPYNEYNCRKGIVSRVLTNKEIHTRGHKVILNNGLIGRTLKVLKI